MLATAQLESQLHEWSAHDIKYGKGATSVSSVNAFMFSDGLPTFRSQAPEHIL